tara:strand:- start:44 stop:730 length:687 start_codon:yes stop_codon:yes gene_type:complete
MNIKEFKLNYCRIKARGFIEIVRKGDGKFGNTFEDLLGLTENNIDAPDIDGHEIKVQSKQTNSKMTLFNKNPEWVIPQKRVVNNYGWEHTTHKGEKTIQSTITRTPNKRQLWLDTTDKLYVRLNDTILCQWSWDSLTAQFVKKFPNAIKVYGEEKREGDKTYFWFNEAYLLTGTSKELFKKLITDDIISVDFRFYTRYNKGLSIRDRGTAFRMRGSHLDKLFVKEIIE